MAPRDVAGAAQGIATLLSAIGESRHDRRRRNRYDRASPRSGTSRGAAPPAVVAARPICRQSRLRNVSDRAASGGGARLVQVLRRVVEGVHREKRQAGRQEALAGGVHERGPADLDLVAGLLRCEYLK